jgi:hypothetical protein
LFTFVESVAGSRRLNLAAFDLEWCRVNRMNGVTKQAEGAEGFRLSMAFGKKGSASGAKKSGSKK